jgi:hypothetical protein
MCYGIGENDPNAFCAADCTGNEGCAGCSNAAGDNFMCIQFTSGSYCLPENEGECTSSGECPGDEVCYPESNAAGTAMVGACGIFGELPTGSECNDADNPNELEAWERCADFYCMNSHCSEVCAFDSDCPDNMFCGNITFRMDDAGDVTASIGMCFWFDTTTPCTGDATCATEHGDGYMCAYYVAVTDEVFKYCTGEVCDPDTPECLGPGDDCGSTGPACYNGMCLGHEVNGVFEGTCAPLCDSADDCAEGEMCGFFGVSDELTTGACFPDNSCENPADCEAPDEYCQPALADATTLIGDCQTGNFGGLENGAVCETHDSCASTWCINGHCTEVCSVDDGTACPDYVDGDTTYVGRCGQINFCLNDDCSILDSIGMCHWFDGSGDSCGSDFDCTASGAEEYCTFFVDMEGALQKFCVTNNCDPDAGQCWTTDDGDCGGTGAPPCLGDLCLNSGYCSTLCDTIPDCTGDNCGDPSTCPAGYDLCEPIGLGDDLFTYACLIDNSCDSSVDCEDGYTCGVALGSDDTLVGQCMPPEGSDALGSSCSLSQQCISGWCIDGHCTEVCADDSNCIGDTAGKCGVISFCIEEQGNECILSDGIPMCQWFPGSNDPCTGDASCPAGEACDYYVGTDEVTVEKLCTTAVCDPADTGCQDTNEACGDTGDPCFNGLCLTTGYCSALCDSSADCPTEMICGGMSVTDDSVTGVCIQFDGSATACTNDAECTDANETCQYVGTLTGVESLCGTAVPDGVGPGEACDGSTLLCSNDLCLTSGFCSAVCGTNADCVAYAMECYYIGFGDDIYEPACVEGGTSSPLCSLCNDDTDCAGDAVCHTSTTNPGEKYCGLPCPNGDECASITGTSCVDGSCKPDADTCDPSFTP